jgi:hypothetical protein
MSNYVNNPDAGMVFAPHSPRGFFTTRAKDPVDNMGKKTYNISIVRT